MTLAMRSLTSTVRPRSSRRSATPCIPSMLALTSRPTSAAPATERTRTSSGSSSPSGTVMTMFRTKPRRSIVTSGTTFTRLRSAWTWRPGWSASSGGRAVTTTSAATYRLVASTVAALAQVSARRWPSASSQTTMTPTSSGSSSGPVWSSTTNVPGTGDLLEGRVLDPSSLLRGGRSSIGPRAAIWARRTTTVIGVEGRGTRAARARSADDLALDATFQTSVRVRAREVDLPRLQATNGVQGSVLRSTWSAGSWM